MLGTTLLFDQLDEDLRRDFGVSLTEYEIMVRLSETEHHQMRMAQLADALAHSRSRITHTVARMERAGLVERRSAADDRRGVVAHLTDAGYALLDNAAHSHVMGVRGYLVDLCTQEDFDALGRVMNAVADKLVRAHPAREIRQDPAG